MRIHKELAERRKARPDESSLGFGQVFTDHMLVARYEEGKGDRKSTRLNSSHNA